MGDCRIRILISKSLRTYLAVCPSSNDNHWCELWHKTFSSDTTVREVCEDVVPVLEANGGKNDDSSVVLWDCTRHPPKDITNWPLSAYSQVQGEQSLTLYQAGWFPSGTLRLAPKTEGIPVSNRMQHEDAQYNLPEQVATNSSNITVGVQVVGTNPTSKPSQILESVKHRFDDDVTMSATTDPQKALQQRRRHKKSKQAKQQERFRKLEDRIRKLENKNAKGKSSKTSAQVQRMLIKSRATGRSNLKQQDRVYFHIVVDCEGSEVKEEFRYFSIQDTVGRGILSQFKQPASILQSELLVRRPSPSDSSTDILYRRLPISMRVYEGIDKGYLERNVNKAVIRWYNPSTDEPTTSVLENNDDRPSSTSDDESPEARGNSPSGTSSNSNTPQRAGNSTKKANAHKNDLPLAANPNMATVSVPMLQPPSEAIHPILALDSYLHSVESLLDSVRNATAHRGSFDSNENDKNDISIAHKKDIEIRKRILRVADFLFGSMLEGALTTLDSYVVVEIVSVQSGRQMFVLTNTSSKRYSRGQQDDSPTYFCLMPPTTKIASASSEHKSSKGFYFCSCRSHFERTKAFGSRSSLATETYQHQSIPSPNHHPLCKHLLALKLQPFLVDKWTKVETITEDQFSQEVLKRLYGGSTYF